MSKGITESVVEDATLYWFRGLGYEVLSGLAIAPGEPAVERLDYKQVFSLRPAANQAGRLAGSAAAEAAVGRVSGAGKPNKIIVKPLKSATIPK